MNFETPGASGDLSRLDDDQLRELFELRRSNEHVLERLNEELKSRDSDAAIDLQLQVVAERRRLAKGAGRASSKGPSSKGPVRRWFHEFLGHRDIKRPDGRPIYRYRMSDDEYSSAKDVLRALARADRLQGVDEDSVSSMRAGAMFVAYCAEWFRRESTSTFLRWDDPDPELFPRIPYHDKQILTKLGLRVWHRPLRKSEFAREFLLTVALEGGFPVRVLADGAQSWLKAYLREIMRRAIYHRLETSDEIRSLAGDEAWQVRQSYRNDDFIALCSELAEKLLYWRRAAETEGGTDRVTNTQILDARHPGWREDLPIYVPTDDEHLLADLLSGLLNEKISGLSTSGVEVRRYLVQHDGAWFPALQLLADGEVAPSKLPVSTSLGRARAVPSGELGAHVSGEIALLEPPSGQAARWRSRPLRRTAKIFKPFPFTAPVTVTVAGAGRPVSWTWPRGEPLRSELLVFREEESAPEDGKLLRFVKAGSASSPASKLYALVPEDWEIETSSEDALASITVPLPGKKLVELVGAVYLRSPDDDEAAYRVETNNDDRDEALVLDCPTAPGFELVDESVELVCSQSRPMVAGKSGKTRVGTDGEFFIRTAGERWQKLSSSLTRKGLCEISWRDPKANIQLERRRIAVVPSSARIKGKVIDAEHARIELEGLDGWTASVDAEACLTECATEDALDVKFTGRPIYKLPIELAPPVGGPFQVVVALTGRDATVVAADGSILRPGSRLDVTSLRGAIVVSPRQTTMCITGVGAKMPAVVQGIDGEFPLSALRSVVLEALATADSQDELLQLDFLGDTRQPFRILRYREAALQRDAAGVRWKGGVSGPAGSPVARMILQPGEEHPLEATGEDSWAIPGNCKGNCLVYLRDGVEVVSRPTFISNGQLDPDDGSGLLAALSVEEYEERQGRIRNSLQRIGVENADPQGLTWLRAAAGSLNGLPPFAFDALRELATSPEALIRLLISASDMDERYHFWMLQEELPFLWLELPVSAWRCVLQHELDTLIGALGSVFDPAKALQEALGSIKSTCTELVELEGALAAVFAAAEFSVFSEAAAPSLKDSVNGYLVRKSDSLIDEPRNNLESELAFQGLQIPEEVSSKSTEYFAGLFAPILLAASAAGKHHMDREQSLIVRRAIREDPVFVSNAYSALLKFYR